MDRARTKLAYAAVALGGVALVVCALPAPSHANRPAHRFGLAVSVARCEGRAVVDERWWANQVTRANEVFGSAAVAFETADRRVLASKHCRLENRADRDVLGASLLEGKVNVFVVESLRDVDDTTQMRRGVHWHSRKHDGAHYVIVSKIAGEYVLAHELGHFFGNRRHSDVPGNIMSYERSKDPPWFDAAQLRRIANAIEAYVSSGELHDRRGS